MSEIKRQWFVKRWLKSPLVDTIAGILVELIGSTASVLLAYLETKALRQTAEFGAAYAKLAPLIHGLRLA